MRALIDILTNYEGAVQEMNDDSSDENIAALELVRAELLQVLQLAKAWNEADQPAIHDIATKWNTLLEKCDLSHGDVPWEYIWRASLDLLNEVGLLEASQPDATGFSL